VIWEKLIPIPEGYGDNEPHSRCNHSPTRYLVDPSSLNIMEISSCSPPPVDMIVVWIKCPSVIVSLLVWKEPLARRLISLNNWNMTRTWEIVPYVQALLGNILLNLRQPYIFVAVGASVKHGDGQFPCISTLREVY
jgi:hypothetical protein